MQSHRAEVIRGYLDGQHLITANFDTSCCELASIGSLLPLTSPFPPLDSLSVDFLIKNPKDLQQLAVWLLSTLNLHLQHNPSSIWRQT